MPRTEENAADRARDWENALRSGRLPGFVKDRLADVGAGRAPWLSTMKPAELLAARSHGVRPIATVSGTCWYHYGWSWTNGHAEGWHTALSRLRAEATAAGANAIVDVRLRTIRGLETGESMDYTVIGTAVRIDGLPPSRDPIVATVTKIEFTRLLEAGIVPVGVAIGAHYDWLTPSLFSPLAGGSFASYQTMHWPELSTFWESVRAQAIADLRKDTARMGNGVLAHTQFGQILKSEGGDKQPPRFLGRCIILGTAIQCERNQSVPHDIFPVVDMRDGLSPLHAAATRRDSAYALETEEDGAI